MITTEAVDLSTGEVIVGEVMPRWVTPPLVVGPPGPCGCGCALAPETSYGFAADEFARDTLLKPFDPWQRYAAIHAGELLPDGRPRFRRVVIVVSRQNGKTHLLIVLALFWMFLDRQEVVLGTSTQTKYAREPWEKSHALARTVPDLNDELPPGRMRGMRKVAGELEWKTVDGARYFATTSNEEAGRSLSIDRVIADELARQFDYGAYAAALYAMRARYFAQWFGLTTPLDARSVVFNDLRKLAVDHIEHGGGDERLGLIEFSSPEDADPLDPQALLMANPNAVHEFDPDAPHRPTIDDLLNDARSAVKSGGEALIKFKTESMCITVQNADPAIDAARWRECLGVVAGFADLRGKVAMVFDVAPSMRHATLYAAAVQPDGRTRVGLVEEWEGIGCADRAARALPALLAARKPRAFGVLPNGPAAAVMADLAKPDPKARRAAWPPRGVAVEEIRGELRDVCMGFAEQLAAVQVVRDVEPLLDGQASAAEKLARGDAWVFSRKGEGDCDALYAAAGALHLARTLPAGLGKIRVLLPSSVKDDLAGT